MDDALGSKDQLRCACTFLGCLAMWEGVSLSKAGKQRLHWEGDRELFLCNAGRAMGAQRVLVLLPSLQN